MHLHTHNDTHFKGASKNLAKELKKQGFDITHSNALNIMSISLGYENYNTYKAIDEDLDFGIKTASQLIEENKVYRETNFPSIKERFVEFKNIKSDIYNTYIHKEEYSEGFVYYLLIELKSSDTGRIFYAPRHDAICLFVYPNVKEGINDYYIDLDNIEADKLEAKFFKDIKHLVQTKNWAKEQILDDTLELMGRLKSDRDSLLKANDTFSQDELKKIYDEAKPEDEY